MNLNLANLTNLPFVRKQLLAEWAEIHSIDLPCEGSSEGRTVKGDRLKILVEDSCNILSPGCIPGNGLGVLQLVHGFSKSTFHRAAWESI
ncbi:hypothetical protein TNCV_4901481 [Trichonephila clavipes]|nr:hypothetical protein TNCV_4901481 [Trichonephila clavipes]